MKGFEVGPGAQPNTLRFSLTNDAGQTVWLDLELRAGLKLGVVLRSLKLLQKASA